jgi:hypothetical protein
MIGNSIPTDCGSQYTIRYSLFIHGHSLAPNGEQILRLIEQGKLLPLYVGLHSSPGSTGNQDIIQRASRLADSRSKKYPLGVSFHDRESADV